MARRLNLEEVSGAGRSYQPHSSFFRREPSSGQRKSTQEGAGLVIESSNSGQDVQLVGETRRGSHGFRYQPKSSLFLQLEQERQRSSSSRCPSTGSRLDKVDKAVLLPTVPSNRSGSKEDPHSESRESDSGSAVVAVEAVLSLVKGED